MPWRYRPTAVSEAWALLRTFLDQVLAGRWPGGDVRWEFECAAALHYDFERNVRLE